MRKFRKLLFLFFGMTLVAIIPFLILGDSFEESVQSWFESEWTAGQRFWLIVGLLAVDIAVPIPSSAVSTYGGVILGFIPAVLASWLGMMVGSLVGFLLARIAGPPLVRYLTKSEDLRTLEGLNERLSLGTIVVTRPLPILSEAAILFMGALRLPVRRLIVPLIFSNLFIAVCYSAIGAWSIEADVTGTVIVLSMVFPFLLTLIVRHYLKRKFAA